MLWIMQRQFFWIISTLNSLKFLNEKYKQVSRISLPVYVSTYGELVNLMIILKICMCTNCTKKWCSVKSVYEHKNICVDSYPQFLSRKSCEIKLYTELYTLSTKNRVYKRGKKG